MKKLLALLLSLCMLSGVAIAFADEAIDTPLVVAIDTLSEKFSTFYHDTDYDQQVVNKTQIFMLTTDRVGGIIYNAIEGETVPYNGTDYTYYGPADVSVNYDEATDITTYTVKIRDDLLFSDGVPVTADDIIFTYYVYADPSYVGSITLGSYNIVGLKAYQTQVSDDALAAYQPIVDALLGTAIDHAYSAEDLFSEAAYNSYVEKAKALWATDVQGIVDYVYANYLDYAPDYVGFTADEISASQGMMIAYGMAMWGFGEIADGVLTSADGTTFDLKNGQLPTIEDYVSAAAAKYAGSLTAYIEAGESATGTTTSALENELLAFVAEEAGADLSAGIPNIAGIKKIDDYTVQVQTNGYEAPAIYTICGREIAPMHYYGDPDQYDYDNNQFGHPFGDLASVLTADKLAHPLGAGPYKFVKYENRVVYYEANEYYYLGEPIIKNFQYKETNSAEVASAVQTGTADGGDMNGTKSNFEMLRSFNSNGELTGDVVTTYSVANLGYGYIGINADTVSVGGDAGSEASKNLRKALATVLAVYRDTAFDSYYGDAASVINYPISSTSWAAPQATDEGYRVAYSVDTEGNSIYTADMTAEEKYAAALETAVEYLVAAGYTFDETTGMFTAAPEGAKLSYEVIIPGDGIGDHPSFAVLTDARNALATIGIELKINDPADSNVLWDAIDVGTQELWCAAWQATIDPDMYQVYHSSNIVGLGGSDSNNYHVADEELDTLILDARKSDDQAYRKEIYKACFDIIMDWAVEIPGYQRQNIVIASTERVNTATVTGDVTTYWGWLSEVERLELNK